MNALLTETPRDVTPHVVTPRARLPGEDRGEGLGTGPALDSADRPSSSREPGEGRSHRRLLLSSAAAMVLVATLAGLHVGRDYLPPLPFLQPGTAVPGSAPIAGNDVTLPPPVKPYGSIAADSAPKKPVSIGEQTGATRTADSTPKTVAPGVPAAPAANAIRSASPQQTEVNEIAALQERPAARASSAPPPQEPSTARSLLAPLAAASEPAVASGIATDRAPNTAGQTDGARPASTIAAPAPHPADPVMTAAKLVPAPLAPPDQVDLLHLVTEMAVMMRDLRTENGALRTQVQDMTTKVDGALGQFDQRLSIAEAKGAMAASMGAGMPDSKSARVPATDKPEKPEKPLAPPPTIRSVKDYRIQAASPRLAMVSFSGGPDGDPSSIQVGIGDDVPGVGRIRSIYQRGSAWVIQTDHGLIQ